MSVSQKTAYFTSADWKALVANGVAKKTSGGFSIDSHGLVEVLTSAFTAAPACSTLTEVAEHGFAMDHIVHNILGLPVDENRKVPEPGTLEAVSYWGPVEGLGSIAQSKLGARYDHAVQSNLVPKGLYLVSTSVERDYTSKTTGLPVKTPTKIWAVGVSVELIDRLVLEPELKRAWKASVHAAHNADARMTAVPESAPAVLAAMDAQIVAAGSARATAYAMAIEGKTSEEVAALDAAVTDLAETKVSHYQAITSGSGESSGDDA